MCVYLTADFGTDPRSHPGTHQSTVFNFHIDGCAHAVADFDDHSAGNGTRADDCGWECRMWSLQWLLVVHGALLYWGRFCLLYHVGGQCVVWQRQLAQVKFSDPSGWVWDAGHSG